MTVPYFQSENVTLYCGDCLEVMPQFEAQSFDAILTDVPYGTTACSWDVIIPFDVMWKCVKHVLKKKAVFVTTASQPFTSKLVCSNLEWFISEWVWRKPAGTNYLNANREPLKNHENVIVFCDGYSKVYNPQKSKGKSYRATSGAVGDFIKDKTVCGWKTENDGNRFPKTVLDFTNDDAIHPTQKPEALYRYLALTYTNPGNTILDFCAGSGTTLVAAIQTGRRAVGIEISQEYCDIAVKRIKAAEQQMRLF